MTKDLQFKQKHQLTWIKSWRHTKIAKLFSCFGTLLQCFSTSLAQLGSFERMKWSGAVSKKNYQATLFILLKKNAI